MGCGPSSDAFDQDKKEMRANTDYQNTILFLSEVPLLKRLPHDQHPLLAASCVIAEFKVGEAVIREGEPGAELFVIKAGQAEVRKGVEGSSEAQVLATLKAGDYFGENALLHEEPRNATVLAKTALTTLKISRDRFQGLQLHQKLRFAQRRAVVAGAQGKCPVNAPTEKTEADVALIVRALRSNQNLRTLLDGQLDDERARQMAEVAWQQKVAAGMEVITEGALDADYFFIVAEGLFEVTRKGSNKEDAVASPQAATTISVGGSFGELALMYFAPRAATVTAKQESSVWVMDRGNFKGILMRMSAAKVERYVGFLNNVEIFNSLLADERQAVAQALIETQMKRGEVILKQGEEGTTFYILVDGKVSIEKDGAETGKLVADQAAGEAQVFGERALLKNEPRAATVKVVSEKATALVLDRDSFTTLLGPLQDLIAEREQGGATASRALGAGQTQGNATGRKKVMKKELSRIGMLGCGGFGVVELWSHKKTGATFALKGISKGWIVKTGTQEMVMNEKNILFRLNSQFIVKLHATYNGSQTLYFLLEPALGGELCAVYRKKGFHGRQEHAKFYVGAVVFAFDHCHERRIIYRDLKPENLMLTDQGHIKLVDMGLAKFVIGKTYTTCGTPDYFSPEVIASSGHTKAVDWWAVGILLFELLAGHAPFDAPNMMTIYSKIMKGIDVVNFPQVCKGDVETLIKGLLRKDPSERLPMKAGGIQNIKDASWYAGFDWEDLEAQTMEPPYKPEVKSNKDMANFNVDKADMPTQLEYKDDGSGWDKDFAS